MEAWPGRLFVPSLGVRVAALWSDLSTGQEPAPESPYSELSGAEILLCTSSVLCFSQTLLAAISYSKPLLDQVAGAFSSEIPGPLRTRAASAQHSVYPRPAPGAGLGIPHWKTVPPSHLAGLYLLNKKSLDYSDLGQPDSTWFHLSEPGERYGYGLDG